MNEIRVLRHTRKSVRTGYDVRGRKEGEGKTKEEKSKNMKQEKQRRTQKRAPESVPFAFICGLRGHSALYILSRRLPFVYSFSFSRMSIFLASFSSLFHSPSSAPLAVVPHVRAVYALSSHNYFAYMPPLPFSLSSATPLSSLRPSRTTPSLSRHYHAAFCKIYVCRRAGDVAAGYLFFQ